MERGGGAGRREGEARRGGESERQLETESEASGSRNGRVSHGDLTTSSPLKQANSTVYPR